jgi:hypothetical protein
VQDEAGHPGQQGGERIKNKWKQGPEEGEKELGYLTPQKTPLNRLKRRYFEEKTVVKNLYELGSFNSKSRKPRI